MSVLLFERKTFPQIHFPLLFYWIPCIESSGKEEKIGESVRDNIYALLLKWVMGCLSVLGLSKSLSLIRWRDSHGTQYSTNSKISKTWSNRGPIFKSIFTSSCSMQIYLNLRFHAVYIFNVNAFYSQNVFMHFALMPSCLLSGQLLLKITCKNKHHNLSLTLTIRALTKY